MLLLFEAFAAGHAGVGNELRKALLVLEKDAISTERGSDLRDRDELRHGRARRNGAVGALHGADGGRQQNCQLRRALLPQELAEQLDSDAGKNCFVDQADVRATDQLCVDLHTAFQKIQSRGIILGKE